MIQLLPAPAHVAAFRFEGTLSGEDYDRCLAEVERCLAENARICVFCELTDFTGLSAEAMLKDLRYALGKWGQYSRFARAAVVTDQHWLAVLSEAAGRWLPQTEMRSFTPEQREAAFAWAAEPLPPA